MPQIEGEPFVVVEIDFVLKGDTTRTKFAINEDGEPERFGNVDPMLFPDMGDALRYMAGVSGRKMAEWRANGLAEIRFMFE